MPAPTSRREGRRKQADAEQLDERSMDWYLQTARVPRPFPRECLAGLCIEPRSPDMSLYDIRPGTRRGCYRMKVHEQPAVRNSLRHRKRWFGTSELNTALMLGGLGHQPGGRRVRYRCLNSQAKRALRECGTANHCQFNLRPAYDSGDTF